MQINRLTVFNFRNIRQAELSFVPDINCLVGLNGEGKTSLLDALYYLSFCKSHLTHLDRDVVRHGEEVMSLKGSYTLEGGDEVEVICKLKVGHRKSVSRNGKEYRRFSEHIGLCPLVIVTPLDQNLIDGASEERRRFFDVVISQYDGKYLNELIRYKKALRSRNALLSSEEPLNTDLIEVYEHEMEVSGNWIYQKRREMIDEFVPIFARMYQELATEGEKVGMAYSSHLSENADLSQALRDCREKDRIVGFTTRGVHRDDIAMTLNGFPIHSEGSQGQRKTYVLSMKLAQFDFLRNRGSKQTPLLLLDDVFDKLDGTRLERLLRMVATRRFGQIFITDTNRAFIEGILSRTDVECRFYTLRNGEVADGQ